MRRHGHDAAPRREPRATIAGADGARLARQAHLQFSEADFDLGEIVLRDDLRQPVDHGDVDKALRRLVGLRAGRLLHFVSLVSGRDVLVNNWAFVYPADPGKESATRRRHSCSARPYPDVMKRHAAVRRDAVVADQHVDSPSVEKGGWAAKRLR